MRLYLFFFFFLILIGRWKGHKRERNKKIKKSPPSLFGIMGNKCTDGLSSFFLLLMIWTAATATAAINLWQKQIGQKDKMNYSWEKGRLTSSWCSIWEQLDGTGIWGARATWSWLYPPWWKVSSVEADAVEAAMTTTTAKTVMSKDRLTMMVTAIVISWALLFLLAFGYFRRRRRRRRGKRRGGYRSEIDFDMQRSSIIYLRHEISFVRCSSMASVTRCWLVSCLFFFFSRMTMEKEQIRGETKEQPMSGTHLIDFVLKGALLSRTAHQSISSRRAGFQPPSFEVLKQARKQPILVIKKMWSTCRCVQLQ